MKPFPWQQFLSPVSFLAVMLALLWFKPSFQFDFDEGIELMKASLCAQGFALYQEIWNEQPPLFTGLMALGFQVLGQSVFVGRSLVLLFSVALLWSFGRIVRLSLKDTLSDRAAERTAMVAMALLSIAPNFPVLSVSAMIGLPSVALVVFSIHALLQYQKARGQGGRSQEPGAKEPGAKEPGSPELWGQESWGQEVESQELGSHGQQRGRGQRYRLFSGELSISLLILSGVLFALSLQTKLFTAPLILLMVIQIWVGDRPQTHWQKRLQKVGLWFLVCISSFLLIGLFFQSLRFDLLWSANLDETVRRGYGDRPSLPIVLGMIRQSTAYWGLGILGAFYVLRSHRFPTSQGSRKSELWSRGGLLPLIWLGIMLPVLLVHQPIWYHYSVLLSVPLCGLAAYGVVWLGQWAGRFSTRWRSYRFGIRIGVISVVVGAIVLQAVLAHRTSYEGSRYFREQMAIVAQLAANQGATAINTAQWIFTDTPMYAFRAGLNVPPEIAVFPRKRLLSGRLMISQLCTVLETYRPPQLLLGRFLELDAALQPCIQKMRYERSPLLSEKALPLAATTQINLLYYQRQPD